MNDPLKILSQNKGKNFVKRILYREKYPSIDNADGSYSTHKMANRDNYSFPMIIQNKDGSLKEFKTEDEAYDYARENNEFIRFDTPKEAGEFSEGGYKKVWDMPRGQGEKMTLGTKAKQLARVLERIQNETKMGGLLTGLYGNPAVAQRPTPEQEMGQRLNLQPIDVDVKNPNLIYLLPDNPKMAITKEEFYGMDKRMEGFDYLGNPIVNKQKKKPKQAEAQY